MKFLHPMKGENRDDDELPESARRALHNYPRIAPSPDFDARVMAQVLALQQPSRLEVFCDRLDEFFAHPILKLLGAACLGAILAGAGAFAISTVGANPVTSRPAGSTPVTPQALSMPNRLAFSRAWEMGEAIPLQAPHENSPPKSHAPTDEKKNENRRSSSCRAASRFSV